MFARLRNTLAALTMQYGDAIGEAAKSAAEFALLNAKLDRKRETPRGFRYRARSKYLPHQGKQEAARRVRQRERQLGVG